MQLMAGMKLESSRFVFHARSIGASCTIHSVCLIMLDPQNLLFLPLLGMRPPFVGVLPRCLERWNHSAYKRRGRDCGLYPLRQFRFVPIPVLRPADRGVGPQSREAHTARYSREHVTCVFGHDLPGHHADVVARVPGPPQVPDALPRIRVDARRQVLRRPGVPRRRAPAACRSARTGHI